MLNAFTVDVEDYYHVTAFESDIHRGDWEGFESRVVDNTKRLLELLHSHNVQGTFFILGWVAKQFPDLVTEIHQAGHEIGSHSFWHRQVYRLTPEEFRADLVDSRSVLEDIIGEPIFSYRAPSFSITRESIWALDILAEEGFLYDSSIFPIYHDRYGIPDAPVHAHDIMTKSGLIREFPPSVRRVGKLNVPFSGGGYFRLLPAKVAVSSLKRLNESRQPGMFYIHPWELDPDQPRLQAGKFLSRRRHYHRLAATSPKLSKLLRSVRFAPLSDALATQTDCAPPHDYTTRAATAQLQ